MFFTSHPQVRIQTRRIISPDKRFTVTDRQERIDGFDQKALAIATAICIGAGGIMSEIAEGLTRKGIGRAKFLDHDEVDWTNLNRQHFFKRDIGKNKAIRLARNLAKHCVGATVLEGHGVSLQDAMAMGIDLRGSFGVVGVDNGKTRVEAARLFRALGMPVLTIAVNLQAEGGYVFVQEPDQACFGCLFPKTMYGRKAPCQTPASKDILKVVAGLALYAIDSLLMNRPRNWNYREVHLAGFMPDVQRQVEKLPTCPLCGSSSESAAIASTVRDNAVRDK